MRPGIYWILMIVMLVLYTRSSLSWIWSTQLFWGLVMLFVGASTRFKADLHPTPDTFLMLSIHLNAGLLPAVSAQAAICLFVVLAANGLPIGGVLYNRNKRGYLAGFIYATLLETLFLTLETSWIKMLLLFTTAHFWVMLLGAVYYVKQTINTKCTVWDLMIPWVWSGLMQSVLAFVLVQCLRLVTISST